MPIFPYVTGVKLKYCSQGIPTTGFYLNHAFMLWHTLKWSVIKLTSIHQKILSSFDYSICVVNSNVTILRPILYTYFFFRELPHIYIYTPIKAEIKSGYHILFYRRNGICRDLLTRGALFTQPSVCTILADPIRTRCRGRDGLPLVGYSESSRRESDMSLGYISYTHACYLCIRLCNLYVIWSEIVYLAFTARCTLRFRYERIQSTVAVNVT